MPDLTRGCICESVVLFYVPNEAAHDTCSATHFNRLQLTISELGIKQGCLSLFMSSIL